MKPIPLIRDTSRTAHGALCCDPSQLDALHQKAVTLNPGAAYGTFALLEELNSSAGGVFIALDAQTIFMPGEGISQSVTLTDLSAFLIPFSEYRRRAGDHPSLTGADPYGNVLQIMEDDTPDLGLLILDLKALEPTVARHEMIAGFFREDRTPHSVIHNVTALSTRLQMQAQEITNVIQTNLPGLVAAQKINETYEEKTGMSLGLFGNNGEITEPSTLMGRMVAASMHRHLKDPSALKLMQADMIRQADAIRNVIESGRLDHFRLEWARDPLLVGLPVHEALLEESEAVSDVEWEWSDDLHDILDELKMLGEVEL